MNDPNRYVTRRTAEDIEGIASSIRTSLGLGQNDRVSMTALLETVLPELTDDEFRVELVDDGMLPDAEGLTDLRESIIRLPDRTYNALRKGQVRARFTAAHELGHLFLHTNATHHYAHRRAYDECSDPEWQADMFAAAFLMPKERFMQMRTIQDAMEAFDVGYRAVRKRAKTLNKRLAQRSNKGRNAVRNSP